MKCKLSGAILFLLAFASPSVLASTELKAQVEQLVARTIKVDAITALEIRGFRPEQTEQILRGDGFQKFVLAVLSHPKTENAIQRYVDYLESPRFRTDLAQKRMDNAATQQAMFLLTLQQKLREKQLDREGWPGRQEPTRASQLWRRVRAFLLE